MTVIDCENWAWFLFEHEGRLILDANCNHNAFGYTYMIELSEDEISKYKQQGRSFLGKLAHDIHMSAPILKNSNSVFKGRDVTKQYSELANQAVKIWKNVSDSAIPL